MVELTKHAGLRCQQRGFSEECLELVYDFGTQINNGGALFYFMSDKNIPDHLPGKTKEKIRGITMVVDPDTSEVLTVYRNSKAMRDIKRKSKFYSKGRFVEADRHAERERSSLVGDLVTLN